MTSVEVLVATMERANPQSLIEEMRVMSPAVIVNQTSTASTESTGAVSGRCT